MSQPKFDQIHLSNKTFIDIAEKQFAIVSQSEYYIRLKNKLCQSILLKVVLYSTQACQYNAHSNNIISYHTAIQKQHDWCQQVEQELLPFRSTCVHHWFLVRFVNKGNNKITELRTVLYAVFCRSLFVMLSFYFLPLFCLSFFDLRILIIPLLSANFSP